MEPALPAAAPLTQAQRDFFLERGYLKLQGCFTRAQAADATADVWTRLGMSATDRRTWTRERVHMPSHRTFDCATFAPRAWAAICELCGGEDRLDPASRQWRDSFIVNLGPPFPEQGEERDEEEGEERNGEPEPPHHRDLDNWHVDGDFFVHYLDSPEQALLVIPLFSDVLPRGGGATVLCPSALDAVARHLRAHPEGVSPRMATRAEGAEFARESSLAWYREVVRACTEGDGEGFVEATGRVGDVYLLHPLMVHSAGRNTRRAVRIITNPPVALREPFRFNRVDPAEHSLVERKTMMAATGPGDGIEALRGWKITMPRERLTPEPPELTLIVAATRSMGIGRRGGLPWTDLRKEMAYFARVTKRPAASDSARSAAAPPLNVVVMGRKTWDSIPPRFRPLRGRLNLVVSRSASTSSPPPEGPEGPVFVASLENALDYLTVPSDDHGISAHAPPSPRRVFVIGGAQIYAAALRLPGARRVLLTRVLEPEYECDVSFPLALADGGGSGWVRRSKEELDAWTGEAVPEGVQEEGETRYEFQMWEKTD
ncbi:dihydrofolate reductase-like domain-containing protein [Durotheca rogersii]|uniref:dihydrofolate reductase-like domain-containing protein n=1 Tax=Durotheca rogersii TaxID=419775 RepID=UPI0022203F08|nr:dihydrofolate reductase-like domain-containing protein [Durotheca rogersii]KAI5855579.1 dihydrofolate reductase-like domain-containing protein [Durotheca rogersii]